MFRNILKSNYLVVTTRNFCEKRFPTIIWIENMMSEDHEAKIKETKDDDNASWKATKGNGKSIYDCENEPWCVPKEPTHDEWEEANKRED